MHARIGGLYALDDSVKDTWAHSQLHVALVL